MTVILAVMAMVAAGQTAIPPRPLPVTEASDASCLALLSFAATDAKLKDNATLAAIYFMGKLFGRNPAIDLQKVLVAAAMGLTDKDRALAEGQRCAADLQAAGGYMQRVGSAMQAAGQPAGK